LLVSAVPELADLMQDADGDGEVNALEFLVVQIRWLQVMSLLVCCKSQAMEICGSRSNNFVCAHSTSLVTPRSGSLFHDAKPKH
jgi:hypothetical protein